MKDGIELQAKYSYVPNSFGYCGPKSFYAIYDLYQKGEVDIWDLKKELEKFVIPMSYLKLIASSNGKEIFDYEVVEAFWIGNQLLQNVKFDDLKNFIIHDLVKVGLKKNRAIQLSENLPKNLVPNHFFHVLYIQFITDKVKRHLGNFDNCHIGWGRVKHAGDNYLKLDYFPLLKKSGQYYIGKGSKKVLKGFVKNPLAGDFISVHWGSAIQKLTERQLRNIEYYTNLNLKRINTQKI